MEAASQVVFERPAAGGPRVGDIIEVEFELSLTVSLLWRVYQLYYTGMSLALTF
jgi:hypothetical protein